jgi:methionyl-tRNA formyltransferase
MRVVVFSVIDDWDIAAVLRERGHQTLAWVRPSWNFSRESTLLGPLKNLAKIVLSRRIGSDASGSKSRVRVRQGLSSVRQISCTDVNSSSFVSTMRTLDPDVFVVSTYPAIFGAELLSVPRHGAINCHPSLLPTYAGAQPGFWVLKNGEANTGVTVHRMTERIDSGEILAQQVVPIEPGDNLGRLLERLHSKSVDVVAQAIDKIVRNVPGHQPPAEARTYFRRHTLADLEIDWSEPAAAIVRLLRAVQPFEPIRATIGSRKILIYEARAVAAATRETIGQVVDRAGSRLWVQTGDGWLEIVGWEVHPLHGWLNWLAQQVTLRVGERFSTTTRHETSAATSTSLGPL